MPEVREYQKIDRSFFQPGNMIVAISGPDPVLLEKVTDRDYYGLGPPRAEVYQEMGLVLNRLVPNKVSGRRCTRKPCELIVARQKAREAKKAEAAKT